MGANALNITEASFLVAVAIVAGSKSPDCTGPVLMFVLLFPKDKSYISVWFPFGFSASKSRNELIPEKR